MIVLFTDFGVGGPYVGQMRAVLLREAPGIPQVDLMADAPSFDPKAAAYLLPAFVGEFPPGSVFLCVVDPGVGSPRPAVILEADGRFFVGPGNGLFELVARRAAGPVRWWEILWRPERLSSSFHGRDLFAPVAAGLARGERPGNSDWARPVAGDGIRFPDWPDDWGVIIYIDGFGNAVTGLRASGLSPESRVRVGGRALARALTFSDVSPGSAFWYENSNGLVELAVNRGRANRILGLEPGSAVMVEGV
ncbi:MAG: SAM-dependent chlorinase/fluorinase [Magnetospirillum sp. WYHS-4]